MINSIKEISINNIKEIMSNRESLFYLFIGIILSYYLYTLVSSILKIPVIIILGILLGNFIRKNNYIQSLLSNKNK